jgi:hypothetical protein
LIDMTRWTPPAQKILWSQIQTTILSLFSFPMLGTGNVPRHFSLLYLAILKEILAKTSTLWDSVFEMLFTFVDLKDLWFCTETWRCGSLLTPPLITLWFEFGFTGLWTNGPHLLWRSKYPRTMFKPLTRFKHCRCDCNMVQLHGK